MPRCSHSGHRHTVSQVLSNVSKRLAVMHDAGYVHRDLKPANVMWLPRENRWTVIDFGCVAGIGEVAPLSFTLAYAPPEVVKAYQDSEPMIESTPALDAWSLGVMAFELLTGAPAFKLLTEGRCRVRSLPSAPPPVPLPPTHPVTPSPWFMGMTVCGCQDGGHSSYMVVSSGCGMCLTPRSSTAAS